MQEHAADLIAELRARLAEVEFPLSDPVEREIRREVFACADELKGLGVPPEGVIVAVKQVASEAGLHFTSRTTSSPAALEGADKLLVEMVTWCIEQYYSGDGRAD